MSTFFAGRTYTDVDTLLNAWHGVQLSKRAGSGAILTVVNNTVKIRFKKSWGANRLEIELDTITSDMDVVDVKTKLSKLSAKADKLAKHHKRATTAHGIVPTL